MRKWRHGRNNGNGTWYRLSYPVTLEASGIAWGIWHRCEENLKCICIRQQKTPVIFVAGGR